MQEERHTEGVRAEDSSPNCGPLDRYDEAIAYLTANPSRIRIAWFMPNIHAGGCLFKRVTQQSGIGCLTQIRGINMEAPTPELTARIRDDERIPNGPDSITVENLPVFAEWQRKLDKELGVNR